MSSSIEQVTAARTSDSRGRPTLRVGIRITGHEEHFDVPSGASTGTREAHEMRDEDGGMEGAIRVVETIIAPRLLGKDVTQQVEIDSLLKELDGTENKTRLGANSMLGVSCAAARAAAYASGQELHHYLRTLVSFEGSRKIPRLFLNLINGGKHARSGGVIQEHHIVTKGNDPHKEIAQASLIEKNLHQLLTERGIAFEIGDEGGVAFPTHTLEESFDFLNEAVEKAGLREEIEIGADAAASSFFMDGTYTVYGEHLSAVRLAEKYESLVRHQRLRFLEDPFEEDATEDFALLMEREPQLTIIGDDLTTTNAESIARAAQGRAVHAVIIKPNQIGTLSETFAAMASARHHGLHCIVSHRSGETMDHFLADLALASGAYGLKAGAPNAQERSVKYNRLATIAYA